MNILVVGNGFDLAHGLPTTYNDFLNFIEVISNLPPSRNDFFEVPSETNKINDKLLRILNDKLSKMNEGQYSIHLNKWEDLIYNNLWIEYFKLNRINIEHNWIDFEKEIGLVIKKLESIVKEGQVDRGFIPLSKFNDFESNVNRNFKFFINLCVYIDTDRKYVKYDELKAGLEKDLERLTLALDKYLYEYVESIEISSYSPDIKIADIDKVISFNYTNTFKHKYSEWSKAEINFVHGNAGEKSSNIVLGVEEYLTANEKNSNVEFIKFKKYYQIIDKQVDLKYKSWFYESNKKSKKRISPEKHNLYIFGHSLDITDKDILRELILRDDVNTKIFYHNDNARGKLIKNMVKIIGQDELVKRTTYPNNSIVLIKQRDFINENYYKNWEHRMRLLKEKRGYNC